MAGAPEKAPSFQARRRLAGTRLGKYEVGRRIGAGGSASVYLARLVDAGGVERIVALKVVHDHLSEEGDFISQFLDEANLLVRLTHPNIVQVHELGSDSDALFLAMEFLHGQPLHKLVSTLSQRGQHIPPDLVAWIGARVADALAFAHGLKDKRGRPLGLVHRDVSPQNVFITYDGQVKLIDFGIARAARRIAQTTAGYIKGKFSYMAPEQITGRPFDHRADLFALGATLHEAATGSRVFAGMDADETILNVLSAEVPDVRDRLPAFPDVLVEILSKSLAAKPEERYQSAGEMAEALDAFVASSGAPDPSSRLADLIGTACQAARQEMLRGIDALRAGPARPAGTGGAPETPSTLPAPARRRSRWVAVAAAFGLVIGVASLFSAGRAPERTGGSSSAAEPALSPSVTIEVVTHPDVSARISIGGEALVGKPARSARPRGTRALEVVVDAPGYQIARMPVVPDRDRSVSISLVETVPVAPSSSASRPGGTPLPTSGGVATSRPSTAAASSNPVASSAAAAPSATTPPVPTGSAPLHL